ncbi:MAG: type II secretion system protein M [Rhodoferax sp.]|nr:type II secretion system protein M [Rhodoferax sp.]
MTQRARLRVWWAGLALREQRWLRGGAVLVAGLLLWYVGLAPALKTLAEAPARLQLLDSQLAAMQLMAAEAKTMQKRTLPARQDAMRTLEAVSQQRLGPGVQVNASADRVTIAFRSASPEGVSLWLAQVRQGTGAVVEQAKLRRADSVWEGTLVVSLPAGT